MENFIEYADIFVQITSADCSGIKTLHKYIRRKSQEDVAFTEYHHISNFIPDDFLADVVPSSQSHDN
jgi:hypothetical protein